MPDDDEDIPPPAAPPAVRPRLPKGGGLALDLLLEQAADQGERAGKSGGPDPEGIVLEAEKPPGNFILGVPAEPAPVTVRLKWWESRGRWTPACTCGRFKIHRTCGHIGPAARALRGQADAAAGDGLARPTASSFAERIAAAAGRRLTPAEWKKLDGLHQCHQAWLKSGAASLWDLARAGWVPFHATLSEDAFPSGGGLDVRDYWLCVAAECRRLHLPIPDFMEAFSDPALAGPELRAFHAARARRNWLDWMDRLGAPAEADTREENTGTDFRLRFDHAAVLFEWRAGPGADFKAIRETDARRMIQGGADGGLARLDAEGLLVLRLIQNDSFGGKTRLSLGASHDLHCLNQLVSLPFMRDRLCGPDGNALPRLPGRLAWHLVPPEGSGTDYRFELRTPEGGVFAEELLARLPGPPALYVTATGIHAGPAPLPEMRGGVVAVPREVMESRVGLRLARRAGIDAPGAVRERVRVVRPRVTVRVWLGPDSRQPRGGDTCWVDASATFPDQPDRRERLGAGGWAAAGLFPRPDGGDDFTERDDRILRETRDWITAGGHVHDRTAQYWKRASMPVSFADKFQAWLAQRPAGVELDLQGELRSFLDGEVRETLRVVVTPADQPDWFDLLVARDLSDNLLTPEELDALRAADGRWVRLPDGRWRRLVTEGGDDAAEALARLGLDGREAGRVRTHALQLADAARGLLSAEDAELARRAAAGVRLRVQPEPPAGLRASLRPYQLEGYHFLCYLAANGFGGVLADDMGLGKTVQTLAWLLHLRAEAGATAGPSLVVCPKSVVENWTAEAARFAPGLRVRAWRGSAPETFAAGADAADLHVVNYAQLRQLDGHAPAGGFLALVLDEAQAVKNPDSDTARAARAVRARHRLALTGTPIENRLLDLWSILQAVMPGPLGNRAEFTRRFNAKSDPNARLRLAARVRPFLLRRAKAQVATDLPERVERDQPCAMEGEQLDLYQAELKSARAILLNLRDPRALDRERFHILTSLLRLRQICCSPRLVNPASTVDGAKLEALRDQLEPLLEEGQKVLVFSQFTGMLDLIGAMLDREFPSAPRFRLDGSTENRGELVADFQRAEGAAVFLLSLKAGGFGLNLTAASTVILYDPWWNPAVEAQAIDRTHRIGQRNQVMACRLIAKDSIEEKIRQLQTAKKSLAADVLGEEAFSKSLTLEDLSFLFE